ncbi:MAG: hypothetical protein V4864_14460 [Pseudomonadota bacterium]
MAANLTERYRDTYRREIIPQRYDGRANVRTNLLLCAGLVAVSALAMGRPTRAAWIALAASLLLFNVFEYAFHRWISHKRQPGLRRSYQRHAGEHHGFFEAGNMTSPLLEDYHVTINPPVTLFAYYVAFNLAFAPAIGWLWGLSAAGGFAVGIALSLLQLDLLHFYYHLAPSAPMCRFFDRFAYMRMLKRMHAAHHDRRLMTSHGFNITHPLCDFLLGTFPKEALGDGPR